jgi:hypothetical protein
VIEFLFEDIISSRFVAKPHPHSSTSIIIYIEDRYSSILNLKPINHPNPWGAYRFSVYEVIFPNSLIRASCP